MIIKTKFSVRQKVYIPELKVFGVIKGIYVDDNKEYSYKIRYFNSADYKECYFYEDELSLQDTGTVLGFKKDEK